MTIATESRILSDVTIELYKEDYTIVGWQIICHGVGVNTDNTSITIYILKGAVNTRKEV
jgi:hypothetical protein